MSGLRFAGAYERAAEQAMSDEHVLGALPDDASQALLNWQLARLRTAATDAQTEEEFLARADAIRLEARSLAVAAAAGRDDGAALAARLGTDQARAAGPVQVTDLGEVESVRAAEAETGSGQGALTDGARDAAPVAATASGNDMGAADSAKPVDTPGPENAEAPPSEPDSSANAAAPVALGLTSPVPPTTGGRRRRRSRKSQPDSEVIAGAAAAAGTAAITHGAREARRRPWLALVLGVVLIAVIAVVLVVLLRGPEADQQASEAPPLPGGGWYEAMFTTPQRTGTPAAGSPGRLDQRLVQLIDGAERTVDVAAYDFGLDNVAEALIAARKRGVEVRVVTDGDNAENPALKKLRSAEIPVVEDGRRALMHHKFAVIDGRTVMTGAWNFAERDTYRHNNNSVVWSSPELARNFTNEFNKMFEGRRFGPTKPKDVPNPVIERDGTRVGTFFASEQQVDPAIAERLRGARSSIAFMAFSFTLDDLGQVLRDKRRDGVGVWGVFESTGSETEFSEYGKLKGLPPAEPAPPFPGCKAGPAVLQDGNPFLLHHKVFVIDARTVIFGSFNFTSNAAEDNDEALLIVDDPALAAQFLAEFCRVYNTALDRAPARR